MKDYWCEAPPNLQNLSIEVWKNISQSKDSCKIYHYPWQNVTMDDIEVCYIYLHIWIMCAKY